MASTCLSGTGAQMGLVLRLTGLTLLMPFCFNFHICGSFLFSLFVVVVFETGFFYVAQAVPKLRPSSWVLITGVSHRV